eukprot:6167656-Amphidinium_carterae.2
MISTWKRLTRLRVTLQQQCWRRRRRPVNGILRRWRLKAQADGYKVIGTGFMRDHRKLKSRLVVQDVRRGPVDPEHCTPTPSLLVLKIRLLFAAVWVGVAQCAT